MSFKLLFTYQAISDLEKLENPKHTDKRLKAVRKALGLLETNPSHTGLNTHKYESFKGHKGEEVFEAYAESKTLATYRIFWHYGTGKQVITIIAITS